MNFKDKKILAVIVGVVVVLLVVGGVFALSGKKAAPVDSDEMVDESIPSISKDELGLSMTASPNKKQVKFSITKAGDIKRVEYEVTYDADSEEDASVKVPKGITGDEEVTGDTFETDYLDLGTCSKNVCKYDTGVTDIKLLLKVTKKDGKVYQAEDSLSLK